MGVFCGGCQSQRESFPCTGCGWKPGDSQGPSPFDEPNAGAVIPSATDTGAGGLAPTRSGDLLALAERCEQATGPDRELEWAIFVVIHPDKVTVKRAHRYLYDEQYTRSLDAAMTLLPDGWALAGMQAPVFNRGKASAAVAAPECDVPTTWARSDAATPPLALCAAALRAHSRAADGS